MRKPLSTLGGDVIQSSHYEFQGKQSLLKNQNQKCHGVQHYGVPQVYCCAFHRSQKMKPAQMSITGGMRSRENAGQLHSGTDSTVEQNWHHRRVEQWEIIMQNWKTGFQGPLRFYIDTRQHPCVYAVEVEAKVSRRTKETREGEKRKRRRSGE